MDLHRARWKVLTVAVMALATLSLHYAILPLPHWVHLLHRRLCYVPIIVGALWFGLPGGLAVAGIISLATLPLALHYEGPFWGNQDLVEIVFYVALGLLTGFLVDRGEAERAKADALRDRLEKNERLAALGRLASGVAHEVRTPLGSIQGVSEILAEDFPEDHPRRSFYDILLQEIERLKRVVQEFLDLGRPIAVEPVWLDASRIVEGCCQSLQPVVEKTGVRVSQEVRGTCRVWADSLRLHQALTNLVRNALQVSHGGGEVRVGAAAAEGGCLFWVEDDGPGIEAEAMPRLFEPFFTTRKDGTGLGLALVRQIVEAHGGWVRGDSRDEGGARFSFWLPCGKPDGGEKDPPASGKEGFRP